MSPFKRVLALLSVVALFAGALFTAVAPANAAGGLTITGVSPSSGPEAGGTSVTITGTGFTGTTDVVFGAVPTAAFTVDSDTQISAVTPTGTAGPADLMIVGAMGMATAPGAFEYVTPATAPGAPTGLTVDSVGNTQVDLSWTAPASDGGSPITGYEILVDDGVSPYVVDAGLVLSDTVAGLTNGTLYTFKVRANNAVGSSPWSSEVTATPSAVATAPDAPTGLVVGTVGNAQVDLSWAAPTSDGGEPISGYEILVDDGVSPYVYDAGLGLSETVVGLTNGTLYTFKVRANNIVGSSPWSNAVTATPTAPATVPDVPTGLAATPGDTQVDLSWTAPADGGSPILGYTVIYNMVGDTPSSAFVSAPATSMTITGLTNGAEYEFFVKAENAIGSSTNSSTVTAIPVSAPTAPSAPLNLAVTAVGDGQVSLSWDAPASDGGSPITGYTVRAADWVNPTMSMNVAGTTATFTGLTNGTEYEFWVYATNAVDAGLISVSVFATPVAPATAPSAPLNAMATAGDGQVTITWDAPSSDGGSPITDYTIDYRLSPVGIWVTFADGVSTATTATVTGLTNGTAYDFRVSATNAIGTSTPSNTVTATPVAPPATAPSVPLNVTATAGDGQITVTWDAPASDGGSPVTEYGINYDDGEPAIMVPAPASSYTITGLTNGTTYTIGVYAKNTVGNSGLSATVTATPTAPPAPAPKQDPAPQTVTVTWNANGGTCDAATSTVPVNTTVSAPNCTAAAGYTANGWDRAVPFIATSDVTVTAQWAKKPVPGTLTVTETKVLPESIKFTYAYDDSTPVDTFVIVDEKGALVCSSVQGTENANTCTAVGAKPGKFYAFAKMNGVEGPRTEVEVKGDSWTKKPDFILPATSVANQGSMVVRVENVEPGCQVAFRAFNPGGIRKFTALRIAGDDASTSARVQFGGWRGDWTVQVSISRCPTMPSDSFETTVRVRAN